MSWIIDKVTPEIADDPANFKPIKSRGWPRTPYVHDGDVGLSARLHRFRLLDADDAVYFYGRSDDDSSFGPLDATRDDYGCVTIQYANSGVWETL